MRPAARSRRSSSWFPWELVLGTADYLRPDGNPSVYKQEPAGRAPAAIERVITSDFVRCLDTRTEACRKALDWAETSATTSEMPRAAVLVTDPTQLDL